MDRLECYRYRRRRRIWFARHYCAHDSHERFYPPCSQSYNPDAGSRQAAVQALGALQASKKMKGYCDHTHKVLLLGTMGCCVPYHDAGFGVDPQCRLKTDPQMSAKMMLALYVPC